jgi:folylpolyglutamate synthase
VTLSAASDILQRALEVLDKRRRPPRSTIQAATGVPGMNRIPNGSEEISFRGTPSISGMREWLNELGHTVLTS